MVFLVDSNRPKLIEAILGSSCEPASTVVADATIFVEYNNSGRVQPDGDGFAVHAFGVGVVGQLALMPVAALQLVV